MDADAPAGANEKSLPGAGVVEAVTRSKPAVGKPESTISTSARLLYSATLEPGYSSLSDSEATSCEVVEWPTSHNPAPPPAGLCADADGMVGEKSSTLLGGSWTAAIASVVSGSTSAGTSVARVCPWVFRSY